MTRSLKYQFVCFSPLSLSSPHMRPPAAAGANFDGSWSVLIMTSSGPCDRSYRFGLSIRNGDIFYNGSAPVNLKGRVSGNDSVRVHVSVGAQALRD